MDLLGFCVFMGVFLVAISIIGEFCVWKIPNSKNASKIA